MLPVSHLMLLRRPLRFSCSVTPDFVRATWWRWYICLYEINNVLDEGFGHLRDTVGLHVYIRKLGNDPRNYLLPAMSVRSKRLPVERTYSVFIRTCLLSAIRPLRRTIAYMRS